MVSEPQNGRRRWIVLAEHRPYTPALNYFAWQPLRRSEASRREVFIRKIDHPHSENGAGGQSAGDENSLARMYSSGSVDSKRLQNFRSAAIEVKVMLGALRSFGPGDAVLIAADTTVTRISIALAALVRGSVYSLVYSDKFNDQIDMSGSNRSGGIRSYFSAFINRWLHKNAGRITVTDIRRLKETQRRTEGLNVPINVYPAWWQIDANKLF